MADTVRVIVATPGESAQWHIDLQQAVGADEAVYHAAPSHASAKWIAASGRTVLAVPVQGVPAGATLVVVGESPPSDLDGLVQIADRLLGPGGCPWDREQTHESLKRHLLEEAYEVLEAIDSRSPERLCEELGDLLLQPVMHAQMASLRGDFDVNDVARRLCEKLVRRHPHVFGPATVEDADEVLRNWDAIKKQEKGEGASSILEGVPRGMASLLRAFEISKRAARAGFEWPTLDSVFDKLAEEESELRHAILQGDPVAIEAEIGDLLFTAVNIARWAGVEPEDALRKMLHRFTQRFMEIEGSAEKPLRELSPREWDLLWERSKEIERTSNG